MFRIKPAAETDSDGDADTALAGERLRYEPVNTREVAQVCCPNLNPILTLILTLTLQSPPHPDHYMLLLKLVVAMRSIRRALQSLKQTLSAVCLVVRRSPLFGRLYV